MNPAITNPDKTIALLSIHTMLFQGSTVLKKLRSSGSL